MCCFASGSKGNCSFVSDGVNNILVDLGISALRAEKCLYALGVDPGRVDIFVTHSHVDHIGGIKTFCKRHPGTAVHCQKESARAIFNSTGVAPIIEPRVAAVGALTVTAVPVPHDVPCFGYIVSDTERSVAVVTDVGTVKTDVLNSLEKCSLVMIEANHDRAMLAANLSYTAQLKARIASSYGHLSNSDCADACAFLASGGVKNFILAHLSQENNDPALAVSEVSGAIARTGVTDARVIAASQNEMTGLFEVC